MLFSGEDLDSREIRAEKMKEITKKYLIKLKTLDDKFDEEYVENEQDDAEDPKDTLMPHRLSSYNSDLYFHTLIKFLEMYRSET
jgi:hypothetical protein